MISHRLRSGLRLCCPYRGIMNNMAFLHILPPIIFMESSEIPLRIRICCPNDTFFEKRVF
ncbi:MAG: hypothetical protein AAB422_02540, partial [Planctomycetota bacterium]